MNELSAHRVLPLDDRSTLELRPDWMDAASATRHTLRRIEFAALMPDGLAQYGALAVPALPVFEDCATAFARGTLIATPFGTRAVEDIIPGDIVVDADGAEDTVTWVGSTAIAIEARGAGGALPRLARVPADPMCSGAGQTDLLAGPAARMRVQHPRLDRLLGRAAVLAPVYDYIDGERIVAVTPHGSVQLFHIMLGQHRLLQIAGLTLETYHPGSALNELASNALRQRFMALFPHIDPDIGFGQPGYNRTTRKVIDALIET